MKVYHIIDSGGLYGAEMMLLDLMEEQKNMGIEPVLCSIGEPSTGEKDIEIQARRRGFNVKIFRMRKGLNIYGAFRILKSAWLDKFDVLHSHGYKSNILLGVIPKRIRKIPILCTLHGWTSTKTISKKALYEWLECKILKHLDAVIVVNPAMTKDPRLQSSKIDGEKLHVITNGISLNKSASDSLISKYDDAIYKFTQESFTLCTIGRLSKEKGYIYLLDAVSILNNSGNIVKLVFIGGGSLLEELQNKVVSLKLSKYVFIAGYKENAKKYLKYFDIFVLSSLTEGLPISLLEAMYAKIPIVATAVGGIPDVIINGKDGLLVPPKDPQALASAIETIKNNPVLSRSLTKRAEKKILQDYSSTLMAKKYINLYHKV